jgi:predicted transposase YbfD/YdcC
MSTQQPSPRNTRKASSTKKVANTVKKDNSPRKVKKIARQFSKALDGLVDPRARKKRIDYPLNEIVFTSLVATICGAESYQDFATFGEEQIKWLKKFFPFSHGIPSHDTFRRIFELLDPKSLENAYRLFIENLKIRTLKHIAIDGKTSRGCYNIKGQCLLHVVSAWDTENGIALGQLATKNDEGKDVGEYNTIPKLIETLDIEGALITIDAGGCYTEIVDAIIEGEGHYCVSLKDNQPTLMNAAKELFAEAGSKEFEGVKSYHESSRGPGRQEERTYRPIPLPADSELRKKWQHLETIVQGMFVREVKGERSVTIRYMISDLPCAQVERLGRSSREHWEIENCLHWPVKWVLGM